MSWRAFLLSVVAIFVVVFMTSPISAQDQNIIHYQGVLLGSGGEPVENGTYEIDFKIWDDAEGGVQFLWSETHEVEVVDGRFDVNLGTTSPLLPQIFTPGVDGECQDDKVFLEIKVAGDEPMTPRIQMGKAPTSFASKRIDGDVLTGPGQLIVVNEGLIGEHPYCELTSDEFHASISLADPRPSPIFPDLVLMADESGTRITTEGTIGTHPFFEINSDFSGASVSLADPRPSPLFADITLKGDETGGGLLLADPRPSPSFGSLELRSELSGASVALADPRPSPLFADITIKGDETGGGILLADPRPSPSFGSLELRSELSGASVALADPRPSPSVPDLLLQSDQLGSQIAFGEMGELGLITDEVMVIGADNAGSSIEMKCNSGFQPNLNIKNDCNGANIAFGIIGDVPIRPVIDIGVNDVNANIGLSCDSGVQPTLNFNTDCDGSTIAFGFTGDIPAKPLIDIVTNDLGANINLTCESSEQPTLEINTDCNGSNIAFGFIGDVPVKPGIDIGVDEISSHMNFSFGDEPDEFPGYYMHADTDTVCMGITWGLANPPAWALCANTSGQSIQWNIADVFIISGGPYEGEFTVNDPDGIATVTLTDQFFSIGDASSNGKIEMREDGVSAYDTEGNLSAVFEPNGIVAPKGNFGSSNTNTGTNTMVVGSGNSATGNYSSVLAGSNNSATGGSAVVCGGSGNSAGYGAAFIGGGQNNNAGGLNAVICGGNGNTASGDNAMVPGGASNTAAGDYSFAGGLRANANHSGAFVWADASGPSLSSDVANQVKVRASGGTYIYSNSEASVGVRLYPGSSQWQSISDRNAKRNIRPVDGAEILEKIQQLPVSRWSYKAQDESIEHIGPMAQDFNSLFGIGEDDRYISSLDPSGVALAAVKELINTVQEQNETIRMLEGRIEQLENR